MIAFVEKPPPGRVPSNWINAGTYVLEPSVLDRIPPRFTVSVERETFPRMLGPARPPVRVADDAYWLDIGTPEKYLEAHADVLAGALGAPPAPGASRRRPASGSREAARSPPTRTSSRRCCSAPAPASPRARG